MDVFKVASKFSGNRTKRVRPSVPEPAVSTGAVQEDWVGCSSCFGKPDGPHAASDGTITTHARAGEQGGESLSGLRRQAAVEALRDHRDVPPFGPEGTVVCPERLALASQPDLTAKAM